MTDKDAKMAQPSEEDMSKVVGGVIANRIRRMSTSKPMAGFEKQIDLGFDEGGSLGENGGGSTVDDGYGI